MAASPPSQRNRMLAILGGLAVAIIGVVLTVLISRNSTPTTNSAQSNTGGGPSITVVVARIAIPIGSKITASEITTVQIPASTVPEDAVKDPGAIANDYAGLDISANQVIVPSMLATSAAVAPVSLNLIKIKDGDVAVSVPNDSLKGAGGYIVAGDHIDILVDVSGAGNVKYGFQDVLVLKSGSSGHTEGVSDVLLLELPRRQAEQLSVILNAKGTPATIVRYALRPQTQDSKGYLANGPDIPPGAASANDTAVTPQQLNTIFGNGGPSVP